MTDMRIPQLRMQVQIPGEQISAAIALRQQEMSEAIREGVQRALTDATELVVTEAQNAATKAITDQVRSYFSYGEGRQELEAAVRPLLAKLTQQMLKPPSKAKR